MDRLNRLYRLHQILAASRYPVSRAHLERELECSRATLTRILAELRDLLGAPLEYDAARGGYRYGEAAFELPGLWFNPSELHALLAAQKLLEEKARFRDLELAYSATHLARLSDNTVSSIETSSLHIDLISDLKRINSLLCSVAYPILESAGALAPSRLKESALNKTAR